MSSKYFEMDREFLLRENSKKPVKRPVYHISEYIERKRVLPPNTPFPGFWSNSRTPYSIEIMDNMAPLSPIQHTAVMKAAQLGLTAAAENVLAYWMDESPAEILFISATESLLEKWATKRLEPLIDSCGFREKIYAQIDSRLSRRSGDKTFVKEFAGGTLDMASAQSAASLRADSKRILIRDEIDGAPLMLRTGEGNWLEVSYARTNAFGMRRKILDLSTPTIFGDSAIHQEFERGDQRVYMVPCPHCKKYQPLEWTGSDSSYGMRAETIGGEFRRAYYLCQFCFEPIFNHHKQVMLLRGKWEPTAKSFANEFRSYHISSLYSPIGMLSFDEIYKKYLEALEDPEGMRYFYNLYLGLPYQETGARPKLEKVIELRGTYKTGIVPKGVLFLTAGIDVQQGNARDLENNPPRLEMEICGHGAGFRSYSILYRTFAGEIMDPFSGAWQELSEYVKQTGFQFISADKKRKFPVCLIFIDSGDGNTTDIVYRFCSGWRATFPTKGFNVLKKQKAEKADVIGFANFKRYRAIKVSEDLILYEISTNYYKNHLYNNLKIARQDTNPQKPGFCDFPIDYDQRYFEKLTAEEKRSDGSFYCPAGRRNESLDCRVLNLCAADVFLDAEVMRLKGAAQHAGAKPDQVQQINHKLVLDRMAREIET